MLQQEGRRKVIVFCGLIILCSTVTGQVLDVDHMMSKTALGHQQDLHPVIQTLYDHADLRCLPTCAL